MYETDPRQVHLRLPDPLYRAIEERADRYKLRPNRWMIMALQRMVEMPAQVTTRQERF